jgi:hypothetical protein
MRIRAVALAVVVAGLAAAGAVGCALQAEQLRREGKWLLERSTAQAQAYAASFDGSAADRQLALFSQRSDILERAHRWQQAEFAFILLAILSAATGYGAHLLALMRRAAAEVAEAPLGGAPSPSPK